MLSEISQSQKKDMLSGGCQGPGRREMGIYSAVGIEHHNVLVLSCKICTSIALAKLYT
jgi:hypothetical protein